MNKLTRQLSPSKITPYFMIVGLNKHKVGFTDLMIRWSCLYKLGTSLEYKYIHIPLESYFSPNIFNFLGFNDSFDLKINSFLGLEKFLNKKAYSLIDFDYSLLSPSHPIKAFIKNGIKINIEKLFFRNNKFIDIPLSEKLLEKYNISTCKQLQDFIRNIIKEQSIKNTKTIIIRLQIVGGRKELYTLINSEIRDFPDGLNLRSSYLKARNNQIIDVKFTENKLKLLVHIRQGDTAIIETPWQTFIPVYGSKSFRELDNPHDGAYAELIDTDDYYNFTKQFISHFEPNIFSLVVSSDGYSKAFSLLNNNLDKLSLTSSQLEKLKVAEQKYNQKFNLFNLSDNCQSLIGENDENLYHLIDAALEADIIIIGFRNTLGMLLKLISCYYDFDNPPIIIELFKTRTPYDHEILLGLDSRKAKVIPVQLDNFNWNDIITKVKKELEPKLRMLK